jgi:hypothetical protein
VWWSKGEKRGEEKDENRKKAINQKFRVRIQGLFWLQWASSRELKAKETQDMISTLNID